MVFSRENSYLPYWEVKGSKQFFERIIPFKGDGPPGRPDRINKCSYVRVIENSEKKIIIHWRYAPDQNSLNFTDFKKSYEGDIGRYFADYVDEYFIIEPEAVVTRKVKKGCYSLDQWNDPMNVITEVVKLSSEGIKTVNLVPAKSQDIPGQKIPGSVVINKESRSPLRWWRFDEGLEPNDHVTVESENRFILYNKWSRQLLEGWCIRLVSFF